jgi:uncharacterized protein YjbI with pentapeptide repeats
MEEIRVEGNDLVKNCVYNIYQKDGNVNVGVCLVIGENNRNNINNRNNGNNGNNGNIRLRKLIGNDELSLIKSDIYGKFPVDLTGADLTDVDLTDVDLIGAVLTGAILTGAVLTRVDLTGADLTGAILTDAVLSNANISYSNLTRADLTGATLIDSTLLYANLYNATLTQATLNYVDLSNAIISRNSLSESQNRERNILGDPKYIEDLSAEQLSQEIVKQEQKRQNILIQKRQVENNNQSRIPNVRRVLSFNNIPPSQQEPEIRIVISEKLLNPSHSKNSCPNFNELYEFIMRQNLSGRFFFIYEGSNHKVVDYGGARRDVFDKILPVYTKKFFKEIEENEDYVILREDVDMDTLIRETEQLILLASASETKIFLKIDPILLSLLKGNQFTYFNNNKRNSFTKLYVEFNEYIRHSNNNDYLLKHTNNKRELMKKLKNPEFKNEELKKKIKQEIRFRRFAIKCGFTNIQQFIDMIDFIDDFYNIPDSFITCELKFDVETILKRIKLFKKIKINDFGDYHKEPIPLERYVRLSQNKQNLFNDITIYNIVKNYPYLIPFLNFILGPKSSDDDRKLFIQRLSGSSSYTGELIIYLSYLSHIEARRLPFYFATCEKYLEIFINREQNRRRITSDAIRIQLLSDTGFGLA